jgi:hypothetical protein
MENNGTAPTDTEPAGSAESQAEQGKRQELLTRARRQLAATTQDFQRGLQSVRSPERRQQLSSAYLDIMQKYLGKAQQTLEKYQSKRRPAAPVADEPSETQE